MTRVTEIISLNWGNAIWSTHLSENRSQNIFTLCVSEIVPLSFITLLIPNEQNASTINQQPGQLKTDEKKYHSKPNTFTTLCVSSSMIGRNAIFWKDKKHSTSSSSDLSANENLSTWFKHRCHCSSLSHGNSYLNLEWEKQEEAGAETSQLGNTKGTWGRCIAAGHFKRYLRFAAKAGYSPSASVSPPARSDAEYSDFRITDLKFYRKTKYCKYYMQVVQESDLMIPSNLGYSMKYFGFLYYLGRNILVLHTPGASAFLRSLGAFQVNVTVLIQFLPLCHGLTCLLQTKNFTIGRFVFSMHLPDSSSETSVTHISPRDWSGGELKRSPWGH